MKGELSLNLGTRYAKGQSEVIANMRTDREDHIGFNVLTASTDTGDILFFVAYEGCTVLT